MIQDFSSIIDTLKRKYSPLIDDKEYWKGESVADFFSTYRSIVTSMFKEYPKLVYNNILCPVGMTKDDLPFEKELLQAQLFEMLVNPELILLPRYAIRTFAAVFEVFLEKGSIGDGLAAFSEDGEYIEFKFCSDKKLAQRITSAAKSSDIFFVCVSDLSSETLKKIASGRLKISVPENAKGYIFGLNNLNLYQIRKNKETQVDLLNLLPERIRGGRTGDCSSPTAIKVYADALLNVNKESFMDFSDFRKKEALEYRVETLLLYGGNPDLTDCYQEYHSIATAFASRNIRVLLPKPYPLSYFDDFPITGICEFDSETKTKLDYQVSAEEFAAIHCLKHYRINLDKPVETYFMQRNQYSISSDKGVKKKGRRR